MDFGIDTQTCWVPAHEWMLRELTRNLLHNALRHTPRGGRLQVEVRLEDKHAALSIEDSGSGIDAELSQRLFQPFSSGNTRSGSGLGLAICQEIVQTLGGQIELRNLYQTPGQVRGLQALVHLPLQPTQAQTMSATPA